MSSMSSSEISLTEAIQTLLSDEELSDVTLEGTDKKTVRAFRRFLAARSRVFRQMLLGDFMEAKCDTIQLGYTGDVIRAIVDYCYTDDCAMFKSRVDDSLIRTMVDLAVAADYFELPELSKKACRRAKQIMNDDPSLACVLLDQAYNQGKTLSTLANDALQIIRQDPLASLLPMESYKKGHREQHFSLGVLELRKEALADVIADDQMNCDEITLFRALKIWSDPSDIYDDLVDWIDSAEETFDIINFKDRHSVAVEIVKSIRLHCISPSDLCTVIEGSGLVTKDELFQAFREQALLAEREHLKFSRRRFFVGWKSSKDSFYIAEHPNHRTECLECAEMTEGIHKWSIEVTTYCNCVWMGVACTSVAVNTTLDDWLGKQIGGWVYGSNGAACHATGMDNGPYDEIYPSFRQGSVVSLTLDLNNCGTVTAQVDDKPPVTIFEDLITDMKKYCSKPRFVPAISLCAPGAVRLLSFGSCKF